MKVVATVEARMAATRLPGKVMRELMGKPVLYRVVERVSQACLVEAVVVATTTSQEDDVIADYCKDNGILYYRGSEEDVLERVVEAAAAFQGEVVVQLGADNPFYDPDIIDQLATVYLSDNFDYICNDLQQTYPNGVEVHVVSPQTLKHVMASTDASQDREDVVRYIWEHPEQFRIKNIDAPEELHAPEIRLTLDYEEDYALIVNVFESLYKENRNFRTKDIIAYLKGHPEIKNININCEQKSAPHVGQRKARS